MDLVLATEQLSLSTPVQPIAPSPPAPPSHHGQDYGGDYTDDMFLQAELVLSLHPNDATTQFPSSQQEPSYQQHDDLGLDLAELDAVMCEIEAGKINKENVYGNRGNVPGPSSSMLTPKQAQQQNKGPVSSDYLGYTFCVQIK